MLRALWPVQGDPDELLFTGPEGERVDRAWLWRRQLVPARDAAGIPWATFHTFRHTCASILFAEGRNPKQVQMWLGRSDPGFTLRAYGHLIDDGLGDADFLDAAKWATDGQRMGQHEIRDSRQTPMPPKARKVALERVFTEPQRTQASAGT